MRREGELSSLALSSYHCWLLLFRDLYHLIGQLSIMRKKALPSSISASRTQIEIHGMFGNSPTSSLGCSEAQSNMYAGELSGTGVGDCGTGSEPNFSRNTRRKMSDSFSTNTSQYHHGSRSVHIRLCRHKVYICTYLLGLSQPATRIDLRDTTSHEHGATDSESTLLQEAAPCKRGNLIRWEHKNSQLRAGASTLTPQTSPTHRLSGCSQWPSTTNPHKALKTGVTRRQAQLIAGCPLAALDILHIPYAASKHKCRNLGVVCHLFFLTTRSYGSSVG